MIFREFPKKVRVVPVDDLLEKVELDDDGMVEITVMFVSSKYMSPQGVGGGDIFIVVGYDSNNNIHESILNESKIIETESYGRKIRGPRSSSGGTRRGGKKVDIGNNNSSDSKTVEAEE